MKLKQPFILYTSEQKDFIFLSKHYGMSKSIKIQIECGETTCASSPSNFCKFVGVKNFGIVYVCLLFPDELNNTAYTKLKDVDGWLKRHEKCIQCGE